MKSLVKWANGVLSNPSGTPSSNRILGLLLTLTCIYLAIYGAHAHIDTVKYIEPLLMAAGALLGASTWRATMWEKECIRSGQIPTPSVPATEQPAQ